MKKCSVKLQGKVESPLQIPGFVLLRESAVGLSANITIKNRTGIPCEVHPLQGKVGNVRWVVTEVSSSRTTLFITEDGSSEVGLVKETIQFEYSVNDEINGTQLIEVSGYKTARDELSWHQLPAKESRQ